MITVIADDLTGAAEIAGICLRYGIDVSFGIDTIPEKEARVTIIATDSRSISEDDAYKSHYQLTKKIFKKNSNQIIFKKCDSVLRGHVLAELSALINISGKKNVLLQPANPASNRCIRDGIYYVNDIKIEDTSFSSDPDFPANTSLVKNLLLNRVTSHLKIKNIHIGNINKIDSGGVFIPNCNSENDLMQCVELYSEETIIGGSAAFFEQFLIKKKLANSKVKRKKCSFSKNYLLISGSTHSESLCFSRVLEAANCPVLVFPENLLKIEFDEAILNNWVTKVSEIYKHNKKVVLRISNSIIQFENSSKALKNRMSLIVERLMETSVINELFIEGGATAYDVLKKLDWKSFTPIDELALGVVRMQYNNDPLKYITLKPGSYQWPEDLLN